MDGQWSKRLFEIAHSIEDHLLPCRINIRSVEVLQLPWHNRSRCPLSFKHVLVEQ